MSTIENRIVSPNSKLDQVRIKELTRLSGTVSRITRGLNFIGRDPNAKTINIDLSHDEGKLIFTSAQGAVGRALLETTLIYSSARDYASPKRPLLENRYHLTHPSTSRSRIHAYDAAGYMGSERIDLLG